MRFFRRSRRFAACLALFALGLQLALSFAHMHAEDFAGVVRPGIVVAATNHGAGGDAENLAHDGCAICAAVQLFGASLLPPSPETGPPPAIAIVAPAPKTAAIIAAAALLPFWSRAPPQG